jgi:predicted site-specific integrase-resolvase
MNVKAPSVVWINKDEALKRLQCGTRTFHRLVKEGRIRVRDFGRNRYLLEDVEKAIEPPKPAA